MFRRCKKDYMFFESYSNVLNTSTLVEEITSAIKDLLKIALDTEDKYTEKKAIQLASQAIINLLDEHKNGEGQKLEKWEALDTNWFTDEFESIIILIRQISDKIIKDKKPKEDTKELVISLYRKLLEIITTKDDTELHIINGALIHWIQQIEIELGKLEH
jgi:hypothetical protein